MMQSGDLNSSSAMTYTSRVVVDGQARACTGWDVQRELSGELPSQVAAVSGLVQATGTIEWGNGVTTGPLMERGAITYEWAGAPHASESIKKIDGVEVARNVVTNPSFETGLHDWGLSSSLDGSLHRERWPQAAGITGDYMLVAKAAGGRQWMQIRGTGNDFAVPEGSSWVGIRAFVMNDVATVVNGIRVNLAFYDADRTSLPGAFGVDGGFQNSPWYEGRWVTAAVELPDGAAFVDPVFQVYNSSGTIPSGARLWLDSVIISPADSEAEALAQVAEYWDGDTPNEPGRIVAPSHTPHVQTMPTTPFNNSTGWIPRKGDPVEIWEGDGKNEWQVFDGVIDSSTGRVGEPGFQSRIIDRRDKLSTKFRHDPLLRIMPPLARAAADYRGVGLTYLYYVDAALRKAGFHATPPAEDRQAVSIPAQSSMWPESGAMIAGNVGGQSGGAWANTWNSVDGVSLSNVLAVYSPAVTRPYTTAIRASMTISPDHAAYAIITMRWGNGNYAQLSVSTARTARVFINGTTVATLPLGEAVRVSMIIDGTNIELRTDLEHSTTGTHPVITTADLQEVQCQAGTDARAAGFHVCYPDATTRWDYTRFTPTAQYRFESLAHLGLIDAAPAITEGTVYDLLHEISEATISAMWIDEKGVFQWAPSNVLATQPLARSFTTADDVLTMPWSDNLLAVRSSVTVKQRTPAITRSRWDNITLYQGRSQSLESEQTVTEFISPPTDEDWIQPSHQYLIYGEPGSGTVSNRGWGSLTGAVLSDGEDEINGSQYLTSNLEKINGDTYKLEHTAGSLPSGHTLELRYESGAASIWPRWRGESFPYIRGFATVQWANTEIEAEQTGPDWAPPLVHDIGPWASRSEDEPTNTIAQRIANYLQNQTAYEWPSVGNVSVRPDPRIQLGDRIRVWSSNYIGVTFTGIIVSIDRAHTHSEATMTIGLRLTGMSATFQTYEAWNQQHPGTLTYQQWSALSNTQTYAQFKNSED